MDRKIKENHSIKEMLLANRQRKETEVNAKQSEVSLLKAEWEERDKIRQDKEKVLQENAKKTVDKRMRMNRIKNIKELQSLQREIDQIKFNNSQLEEELITVMEDLETREALLKEKQQEIEKLEEQWKGQCDELGEQVAAADKVIAETSAVRQEVAARLNGDLIKRYELIFSRRGGTAVVTVTDGICQGCHMNIPPQLWNETLRSERLNLCPSCQRILYHKQTIPTDEQI